MTATIDGDWRGWDTAFSRIRCGPNKCLFTLDEPTTQPQRYMRTYFNWLLRDKPKGATRFLEVGSGRGSVSQYLAHAGYTVELLDRGIVGLDIAKENWRHFGMQEPTTIIADCQDTGLREGERDVVFSIGLLEHFTDPLPTIKESCRLVREGGMYWHVIIQARGNTSVFRNQIAPGEYQHMAAAVGLSCECVPTLFSGVSILRGYK